MLATCKKCGAILEYDPETSCMECPNDKYRTAWVEAEYIIAGWDKEEVKNELFYWRNRNLDFC